MITPPERGDGEDRLGDLIRRAYSPPKELKAPVDLASRVVRAALNHPRRPGWLDQVYAFFESPFRWIPATAAAAVVILVLGIAFHHSDNPAPLSAPNVVDTGSSRSLPASFSDEDPLGPDFFKTDEIADETVSVELAEGWNAVTIEDEESNTALVYFYSKDEVKNATGTALPRTQ